MARLAGYRRRIPITVVTDSAATPRNVRITVPTGLDELWDTIDANGYGVRVTAGDGETLIDHNRQAWTLASRELVLDIEGVATPGATDRAVLLWLYYAPTATPTNASTAVAVTSQLTGYIELGMPGHLVTAARPPAPTRTAPADRIQKTVDDAVHLWLDWTSVLQLACRTYQGQRRYEEPYYGSYQVLNSVGTAVPAMAAASSMRWVTYRAGGRGVERVALRVLLQSGTDTESFTVEAVLATTVPGVSGQVRRVSHSVGLDTTDLLLT